MSNQLVVIDPRVANYQSLIEQLGASYSYLLLNADSDGVTQIATYVAANPGFDAIHLISHGSPGRVAVGTSTLSEATIGGYTVELNRIGASLNAGGDLLIYGCDVAQGVSGHQLITDLSRLTRLDVAASTNRTGSSGDWVLEAATGPIANALPEVSLIGDLATNPTITWSRLFGSIANENGKSISIGLDGSIYMSGTTYSTSLDGNPNAGSSSTSDAFLVKFSADGKKLWSSLIGGTSNEAGNSVTAALDGSIYVTGNTTSALDGNTNAGGTDAFIAKFSADGKKLWTTLLGGSGTDSSLAAASGSDGAIYVTGSWGSASLDGQARAGTSDAYIAKFSADGKKLWTTLLGGTGTESGQGVTAALDGSIYVTGQTTSALDGNTNAGSSDAFIAKFSADGEKLWTTLLGGTGLETCYGPITTLDGSIYVTGNTSSALDGNTNAGGIDAFIAKFSADGRKLWTKLIGGASTEYGYDTAIGPDGAIYVSGFSNGTQLIGNTSAGGYDVFIAKFAADGTRLWTKLIGGTGTDNSYGLATGLDGSIYLVGDTTTALNEQPNAGGSDAFVIKLLDDITPPTIAITSDQSRLNAGQTATLTFTLSESSDDFGFQDISVEGGTLTDLVRRGSGYTATFTPTANSNASGTVSVTSNKFSDSVGNFNVDGSDADNRVTMSVDTVPPTIAISSNEPKLYAGQTAVLRFTLSETSTDFTESDVSVTSGTLTNFTGSGTAYTATFVPAPSSKTNPLISVASRTFHDSFSNFNIDGNDVDNRVALQVNTNATLSGDALAGSVGLAFDGGAAGMMILTGNNTNSGTITIGSGTLQIGDGGTSGSLGSGPVVNQGTLAIDRSDTYTLLNVVSGSGSFVQNGSGTVVLAGINTYTGPTIVTSGKLLINGAITGGGVVTVGSGASLAGSGSVAGATILSSGATLSPGNSPGTFTFGNGLTLASGSTLSAEINGTTAGTLYDQVVVVGSVNLTGATLSLTLGYTAAYDGPSGVGDTFTIISNDGSDSVVGTFSGLPEGGVVSVGAQQFKISYVGLTGNDVTLKVVCFSRGTMIQTTSGPVPIEDLQIGDRLTFYVEPNSSELAKVNWIGRQTFHPVMAELIDYLPIKISANALGPGQPFKDLYVSPDHAILFDGTLIHAKVLVNGTSIVQMTEWAGDVEYFHIETENHELVYANGVPAETFIDNVSRKQFDNYAEFEAMYPNALTMTELDIPRVLFRRQLSMQTLQRLNALEEVWDARYRPTEVATVSV